MAFTALRYNTFMKAGCFLILLLIYANTYGQDTLRLSLANVVEMAKANSMPQTGCYSKRNPLLGMAHLPLQFTSHNCLKRHFTGIPENLSPIVQQPNGTVEFQPVHNNNSSLNLAFSQSITPTVAKYTAPRSCSGLMILTGITPCTMPSLHHRIFTTFISV